MMKYVNDCVREEVKINGKEFFPNSGTEIKAFVIKVAGKEAINRPCLVYFHGGAAISGTAEMYND
jgi:acetyl esterase/lipase